MKTVDFPACCTAKIVTEFGESDYAEGGPLEPIKEAVNAYLKIAELNTRLSGLAVVVVTTNNEQSVTNKVLRERGYKHSKWMKKRQHPATKIRIWHKPLFD